MCVGVCLLQQLLSSRQLEVDTDMWPVYLPAKISDVKSVWADI